ncbi:MAG: riboflavin synthase [Candidatus Eisenbacteria bacterium]|nr:riboflavin synthase [Candidatus Eisenbacteria bacterium]
MFTGLIETVGTVRRATRTATGARLTVDASFGMELETGESVSVNGACLTVVGHESGSFVSDAVRTTLERTTLGAALPGTKVNLERALRVGDRLGGHFVTGHVDAATRVRDVTAEGDGRVATIELPGPEARYVALRGSVALDGISLTVSGLGDGVFSVALIPETLRSTTAGSWKPGTMVNLETDLLARHLDALLEGDRGADGSTTKRHTSGITHERLEALGFTGRKRR